MRAMESKEKRGERRKRPEMIQEGRVQMRGEGFQPPPTQPI